MQEGVPLTTRIDDAIGCGDYATVNVVLRACDKMEPAERAQVGSKLTTLKLYAAGLERSGKAAVAPAPSPVARSSEAPQRTPELAPTVPVRDSAPRGETPPRSAVTAGNRHPPVARPAERSQTPQGKLGQRAVTPPRSYDTPPQAAVAKIPKPRRQPLPPPIETQPDREAAARRDPYAPNPNFGGQITPAGGGGDGGSRLGMMEGAELPAQPSPTRVVRPSVSMSPHALSALGVFDETELDGEESDDSAGSLGAWEEAERAVLHDEGDTPWTPSQRRMSQKADEQAVGAANDQPNQVVVVAGGSDDCNDKLSRSQAGYYWNKQGHLQNMIMGLLVTVALFGDDVRILAAPVEWDDTWSAGTLIVMLIFAIEWLGNCAFQRGYFLSLFFFLDLLATLSLMVDVNFIRDAIFSAEDYVSLVSVTCTPTFHIQDPYVVTSEADLLDQNGAATSTAQVLRSGRAARVGARAARVVRIIRVCRVLRVFKMFRFLDNIKHENDESDLRANPTKIGSAIAGKAAQRVVIIILTVFVMTSLLVAFNETLQNTAPQVGLHFLVSYMLASGERGSLDAAKHFMATTDDMMCLKDMANGTLFFFDADKFDAARNEELEVYISDDDGFLVAVDVRHKLVGDATENMILVMLIVVLLAGTSMTLTHDAEVLVVAPISRIIKSVNKMEETLKFLRGGAPDEEVFEMNRIASAMDKMATLLRIGFGDAGNAIISKNLGVGGTTLNPMLPGRHVTAIFGFCDIRKFTDTTEVLRAQVMPFVNFCADIVHERAAQYGGAPNKNVGDAFLIVWKTETFSDKSEPTAVPSPIKSQASPGKEAPGTKGAKGTKGGVVQKPAETEPTVDKKQQARERAKRQRRLSLVPTFMSPMGPGPLSDLQQFQRDNNMMQGVLEGAQGEEEEDEEEEEDDMEAQQTAPVTPSPASRGGGRVRRKTTDIDAMMEGAITPAGQLADTIAALSMDHIDIETPGVKDQRRRDDGNTPRYRSKHGPPVSTSSMSLISSPSGESEHAEKADNALDCFISCIVEIATKRTEIILRRKLPRLFMRYPEYKLALGFGLHHGWAIEGSLGSKHKVDASYLSPHVHMSDTLEALTKVYRTPILMSGQFVRHLSRKKREQCRMVDRVQFGAQDENSSGTSQHRSRTYDLYTCDQHLGAAFCSKHAYCHETKGFLVKFRRAMNNYVSGDWPTCQQQLQHCLTLKPKDGPSELIPKTLANHSFRAPSTWQGYRQEEH